MNRVSVGKLRGPSTSRLSVDTSKSILFFNTSSDLQITTHKDSKMTHGELFCVFSNIGFKKFLWLNEIYIYTFMEIATT